MNDNAKDITSKCDTTSTSTVVDAPVTNSEACTTPNPEHKTIVADTPVDKHRSPTNKNESTIIHSCQELKDVCILRSI